MRKIMRICIIPAIAGFLCSCSGDDKSPAGPPPIGSKTLAIYGRPNEWAYQDDADLDTVLATMRQEAEALAVNGWDGGQIELWGWVRYSRMGQAEAMERIRVVLPAMIKTYRALDLWLYISGANDNQGLGKYGDPGRPLASDWKYIEECLAMLVEAGPDNLVVQPVCETQTSTGQKMEARWAEVLKPLGYYLVSNGNVGRPSKPEEWADAYNWHPWSLDVSTIPPDAWGNNDTGLAIREMGDGDMYGPANPTKLAKYIADGRAAGLPAIMVYAWGYPHLDLPAIEAINGVTP